PDRRPRPDPAPGHPGLRGRRPGDHQRGRGLRRHGPDARDVQGPSLGPRPGEAGLTVATGLVYLVAAVLFVVGLKFLSSPRGAPRGNQVAAVGMVLALAWTVVLLRGQFTTAGLVICVLGVVIGS